MNVTEMRRELKDMIAGRKSIYDLKASILKGVQKHFGMRKLAGINWHLEIDKDPTGLVRLRGYVDGKRVIQIDEATDLPSITPRDIDQMSDEEVTEIYASEPDCRTGYYFDRTGDRRDWEELTHGEAWGKVKSVMIDAICVHDTECVIH